MSKLRIIGAKKMEKLLLRLGFERIRHHGARVFARPLINEILREIEISIEDDNKCLERL